MLPSYVDIIEYNKNTQKEVLQNIRNTLEQEVANSWVALDSLEKSAQSTIGYPNQDAARKGLINANGNRIKTEEKLNKFVAKANALSQSSSVNSSIPMFTPAVDSRAAETKELVYKMGANYTKLSYAHAYIKTLLIPVVTSLIEQGEATANDATLLTKLRQAEKKLQETYGHIEQNPDDYKELVITIGMQALFAQLPAPSNTAPRHEGFR